MEEGKNEDLYSASDCDSEDSPYIAPESSSDSEDGQSSESDSADDSESWSV